MHQCLHGGVQRFSPAGGSDWYWWWNSKNPLESRTRISHQWHLPEALPDWEKNPPVEFFWGWFSSWWLNQPIWKICSSKCESSPNRDEHKKIFETTTSPFTGWLIRDPKKNNDLLESLVTWFFFPTQLKQKNMLFRIGSFFPKGSGWKFPCWHSNWILLGW